MKKKFFLVMAAVVALTACNNEGKSGEHNADAPRSSELKIAKNVQKHLNI